MLENIQVDEESSLFSQFTKEIMTESTYSDLPYVNTLFRARGD